MSTAFPVQLLTHSLLQIPAASVSSTFAFLSHHTFGWLCVGSSMLLKSPGRMLGEDPIAYLLISFSWGMLLEVTIVQGLQTRVLYVFAYFLVAYWKRVNYSFIGKSIYFCTALSQIYPLRRDYSGFSDPALFFSTLSIIPRKHCVHDLSENPVGHG